MKLFNPKLLEKGFVLENVVLPAELSLAIQTENWSLVDQIFKTLTAPSGALFHQLHQHHEFNSIEFIISLRDAANDFEEDGIWHDDGSRVMAFSLSLTSEPLEGGVLEIKHKTNPTLHHYLPTPKYGEMIIFLTGEYGFLHKINRVTKNKRLIIAGWCS